MSNEELNKNELKNNTSDKTSNTSADLTEAEQAPVSEQAEETSLSQKEISDIFFGNEVNDDLLSEIFDDHAPKKKKVKKSVQKTKAETNTTEPIASEVTTPEKPSSQKTTEKKGFLFELYDWVEVIAFSAAFVLILFTFILRLAVVDGPSMEDTLHDKEMLIVSGLFYTPENDDIIVFSSPNYKDPIVKRIIATENQTVDIDFETWTVTVDGKVLNEDYVKKTLGSMRSADIQFPLTVPKGHVFVMGDNRNDSLDSRNSIIGLVDERYILGKVYLRISPLNKFGKVD